MPLNILSAVIVLLTVVYISVNVISLVGLFRLASTPLRSAQHDASGGGNDPSPVKLDLFDGARPSVSVIVPARNEEERIGRCLDSLLTQDYPEHLFEIFVVDDNSCDRTPQIVDSYREKGVKLLKLGDVSLSGKKAAINLGIQDSKGEVIFTTDADCVVPPTWIKGMVEHLRPDVGLVAGRTGFPRASEKSLFHKLQSLEFLGIVACEAGAIGAGFPTTCNASNLAYRREAFEMVGGFGQGERLISGDDDLLMQTISRKTPWKIVFSKEPETFVKTQPAADLRSFFHQRIRWASKCAHYPQKWLVVLLGLVFFYFLLLLITVAFSALFFSRFPIPLVSFLLKATAELAIVWKGCVLFNRLDLLPLFPIAEAFHIPYIVTASILGFLGKFNWKGRVNNAGIALQ